MTLPALALRNRIVPDGPESREEIQTRVLIPPPSAKTHVDARYSAIGTGARSRHIFQGRERVAYFFPKDTTPPV
jgi:hypothetical protein